MRIATFNLESLDIAPKAHVDIGTRARLLQPVLDRAISADRRFSILHHGGLQMVDHILASHALYAYFRGAELHNEWLADEAVGFGKGLHSKASYQAPLFAEFSLASGAATDAPR